ncbi:MAG: B12-binding domain-containing radical SAM protein [Alphaproteobacteria bacterium]|nr:B12-binding domain-containing radical SAM protein [Alphaproteobacteria bacterium]
MFPLSLGYLAGYIEEQGYSKVSIVDEQIDKLNFDRLRTIIESMPSPRIVGITVLTATCGPAYQLAREVKAIDPDAIVAVGGVHVTVLPDEPFKTGVVDIAVLGEGEVTFGEIVQAVMEGRDYRDIPGASYLADDGAIIQGQARELVKDLNTLPPLPYHMFAHNKDKYSGFYSIQTSRGCPYKCTFCSQRSMTALSYRYVTTERAIQDIETLIYDYDADIIRLLDDNIAVNKKRMHRLLDQIIERGLHKKVSFEGPMRGDNIDEALLDKFKEANFTLVTFGLETASERLMEEMVKGETVEEVVAAIKMSAERGFSVGTTLIFGLPNETFKDRLQAIRLVNSLPLDSVRFNILTPYPGTPVYHQLALEGKVEEWSANEWANFSVQYMWEGSDLPYVPKGTNKYALMATAMFANLYFYLKPSGFRKMITAKVAGGNVIKLPENWLFSTFFFRLARLGLFLGRRFMAVLFLAILTKTMDLFRSQDSGPTPLGSETVVKN